MRPDPCRKFRASTVNCPFQQATANFAPWFSWLQWIGFVINREIHVGRCRSDLLFDPVQNQLDFIGEKSVHAANKQQRLSVK